MKSFREAELQHGRVAMYVSLFLERFVELIGRCSQTPLFLFSFQACCSWYACHRRAH
jgi:hypothetical protein